MARFKRLWTWIGHVSTATWLWGFAGSSMAAFIGSLFNLEEYQIVLLSLGVLFVILAALGTWWIPRLAFADSSSTNDDRAKEREGLPWATPEELAQPYVVGRRFRISQVPIPTRETVIRGKTWENCLIEGPAVIWLSKSQLFHSTIIVPGSDIEPALWERASDTLVQGGIAVVECAIRNCVLRNLGFMGTRESLQRMREAFGVPQPGEDSGGD